jgi:hypothetical protein
MNQNSYQSKVHTYQSPDPFIQNNYGSKSDHQDYHKKENFRLVYKSNYLLIALFFLTIFLILVPIINIVLLIVSSILVYSDAKQIIATQDKEKMFSASTWRPFSWFLMSILFWVIGYPLYLLERKKIWNKYHDESSFIAGNNLSSGIVVLLLIIWLVIFGLFTFSVLTFGITSNAYSPQSNNPIIYTPQYSKPIQNIQNMDISQSAQNGYEKVTLKGVNRGISYFFTVSGYSSTISSDPGKEFIFCDVEIENIGEDSLYLSSASFSLEDPYGYKLEPELYSGNDGLELFKELYPGQKAAGIIAFQVDTNSKGYKLFYKLNGGLFDQPILASWIIN